MSDLDHLIDNVLDLRREAHLLRSRRVFTPIDSTHVLFDGRRLTNFCSNDYLGLTHHPRMLAAIREVYQAGAGAAGLISGHSPMHASAEAAIAKWKQTEAALLMPSGYQANLAAIQTLHAIAVSGGRAIRFIVDKLAHASLIDAIRQTAAPMRVYPHNGVDKLARLLNDAPADELQVVVTESIFSMDGDAADLPAIVALKNRREFVLVVDEAHGSGVYGPGGSGLVAELGLREGVDISIITLSKTLGIAGGAICASRRLIDAVLNLGRAYIYSTAISPIIARLATEAIAILHDEPQRQIRIREIARRVRAELNNKGVSIPPGDSPIIPVRMDTEERAIIEAERLADRGMLIMPVRPPTVPRGTSRLRVTLSSQHTDADVSKLIAAL
ncbi:MAG: 8-amino-7-oxononanoate synthase [Burkholderiales bacterium]|nr:8-amino-7-oxononanoate synthase [Phycisphaerae bacterium]